MRRCWYQEANVELTKCCQLGACIPEWKPLRVFWGVSSGLLARADFLEGALSS